MQIEAESARLVVPAACGGSDESGLKPLVTVGPANWESAEDMRWVKRHDYALAIPGSGGSQYAATPLTRDAEEPCVGEDSTWCAQVIAAFARTDSAVDVPELNLVSAVPVGQWTTGTASVGLVAADLADRIHSVRQIGASIAAASESDAGLAEAGAWPGTEDPAASCSWPG